jgi:pyridoxal phosphate enzyme (YggS family)
LLDKRTELPADIEWHLIGHLQTNKVKYIVPFISLIHSVDSMKLLEEIEKHSKSHARVTNVLIQIHIASEETKHGLSIEEARKLFTQESLEDFEHIRIRGLMGMATLTDNHELVRKEFRSLKTFYDEVRLKLINVSIMSDIFPSKVLNIDDFNILSMGMSNDYKIAIEEESNMVRLGSAIFSA